MNAKAAPTDDEHFRKAILYAFDYASVVGPWKAFGNGETGLILPNMAGYVPIEPQPRTQNLEKARQELALSKYANNLKDVKVVFHFCGGLDFEEEVGLQLQADMAKLGVKVEVAGPPWPQFSAECASAETTPNMTIFLFAPQAFPTYDYYLTPCSRRRAWAGSSRRTGTSMTRKSWPCLDQTRAEPNPTKRLAIYTQLQPLIAAHALAFYPYQKPTLFAHQSYIAGPKESIAFVGPSENMHNWRINLTLKAQITGQ